ncbi:hypothetical protein SRHO_G00186200 [Serrasalmus rhombeus]
MICVPTREQCEQDTAALLQHLTKEGHKASLSELQFTQRSVRFLGHLSRREETVYRLTFYHSKIPKPSTNKQVTELQKCSTAEEWATWKRAGCIQKDGVWMCPESRPCLPKCMFPYFAKLSHRKDHASKGGMVAAVKAALPDQPHNPYMT